MSQETAVYDLGNVDRGAGPAPSPPTPIAARVPLSPGSTLDWTGSLSLFVPGGAQILRGHFSVGLCLLSCMGFIAVLFWAVRDSLERLIGTLGLLGYPREFGVWALAAIFGAACLCHLVAVLVRTEEESGGRLGVHPAIPGIASFLVPGWGQMLNGDRKRAALFLFGLWTVAAAWILAATPVRELLDAQGFFLPRPIELFTTAAVRWTLPAVIWTLAVYDAVSSAAGRR